MALRCSNLNDKICHEKENMASIKINTVAPDFVLKDFNGNTVRLSEFKGRFNLLLVFNRGFL